MNTIHAAGAERALPGAVARPGDWLRLALVGAQLVLVLAVIYRFQLESRTFFNVMALACAGFVVHAVLPLAWRLPFFVALSLASIVLAFGALDGGWLIALGLVLIGICHLRLRLALRVALLLLTAGVFALWRMQLLPAPWSVAIWPILGAMFMFRLALYLHALEHDEKQPSASRTLAYFFMLPNVCFPLYPVVDYLTMRRTYFDRDAAEIYQTGVKWVVRGLIHLILYRFVYVHLSSDPLELRSLGDLLQFLLATFLLYLRVSGQFHLICGVLHLFGFRLPETHHLYFLSASFTDFWRRINIYWKDFMMKLVYYPSFFALKRWGAQFALVGSTLIVFAGTWVLHSYQWFWLRGGFPLEPQDGLFWGTLGALVVVGALREMKRSRQRKLGAAKGWSFSLAWRTVATFSAICVLWSLWSAESVMTWLVMWSAAGHASWRELLVIALLLAAAFALAGRAWRLDAAAPANAAWWRPLGVPLASLLVLLGLSATAAYAPVWPRVADVVASLRQSTLNARDAALQHKGYYENLDNIGRLSAQLWSVAAQKPAHWIHLGDTAAYEVRKDFSAGGLRPNASIVFNDQPLATNSWGMRDVERTLAKPAGVVRIAVVGPSHVMGSGVADADVFTRQLEARLNRSDAGPRYEVLNFGVAARALTQQLAVLDEQVLRFQPDLVLITDNPPRMASTTIQHLMLTIARGFDIPHSRLHEVLRQTGALALGQPGLPVPFDTLRGAMAGLGVATRMPWAEADQRLRRASDTLVAATLQEIADTVRRRGAVPVFVALDTVNDPVGDQRPVLDQARAAGMRVFDLLDVWQGRDFAALRVAAWDNHPNAAGHALIAERLGTLLHTQGAELGLGVRPTR